MTKSTKAIKATKKQQVEVKNKIKFLHAPKNKPTWMPCKEASKSDLPGVVETTSLGQIKKPKPSKKP